MIIHVTDDHIKKGTPNCNTHCPIALALKTALPTARITVGLRGATIDGESFRHSEIINFVRAFDKGQPVEPFSFELPIES